MIVYAWSGLDSTHTLLVGRDWVLDLHCFRRCEIVQYHRRFSANWFDSTWIELVTSCGEFVVSVPIPI